MGKLDAGSKVKLASVDPRLQRVVNAAVAKLPFDCVVSEGLRSKRQAILNYCHGRTEAELQLAGVNLPPLPGPKITWTLKSKHCDGKAVDIYPVVLGKLDDGSHGYDRFDTLYHGMMAAAAELKIRLRYGGDWDMDGRLREHGETDSPHFELV